MTKIKVSSLTSSLGELVSVKAVKALTGRAMVRCCAMRSLPVPTGKCRRTRPALTRAPFTPAYARVPHRMTRTTLLLVVLVLPLLANASGGAAQTSSQRRCGRVLREFMEFVCDGVIYDPYESAAPKRALFGTWASAHFNDAKHCFLHSASYFAGNGAVMHVSLHTFRSALVAGWR